MIHILFTQEDAVFCKKRRKINKPEQERKNMHETLIMKQFPTL